MGSTDEAHVSTEQDAPQADPRVSGANADQERPEGTRQAASERPEADRYLRAADDVAAARGAKLTKADRVRSAAEYEAARRSGTRRSGRRFAVIVAAHVGERGRIGISVPRNVGNAVNRNRIRRLVREYYRTRRDEFPDDTDVLVVVRPGVGWLRLRDLTEVGTLVRQACCSRPSRSG